MKEKAKLCINFHNYNTDEYTAKVIVKILAKSIADMALKRGLENRGN